ncbi:uncharacterized protein LOC127785212 [Oryza glaberrima]|uniref:uncharacterized protein LOC127785212 n=1 Tax=Oryza glaberrima TaxID=4538 RepID=UPI00224C1F47|nr:uncharacterized protein LOC127785212 [Oryza glaberrima]
MDTVGARLSRSSTRYGPVGNTASSFSGPVRKWRKAWVPIAAGGAGYAGMMGPMGVSRGNKVVLFRWAPVNGGSAGGGGGSGDGDESAAVAAAAAAATRRRFVPASGVAQNSTKKSGSTELNLNLGLEDPDDDSDADLSADEQRDSGSNQRSDNRLKRKAF